MDLADTGGLSARTHRPRSRFRVPERRPVSQCLWREDERTRYVPPHRSAQSTDRRLWWYHLTRLRRGPAFLFATAGTTNCCDQTVGLVPPSLTNSVPVIVEGVHCFVLYEIPLCLNSCTPGRRYSITPFPKFPDLPGMENRAHFSYALDGES